MPGIGDFVRLPFVFGESIYNITYIIQYIPKYNLLSLCSIHIFSGLIFCFS